MSVGTVELAGAPGAGSPEGFEVVPVLVVVEGVVVVVLVVVSPPLPTVTTPLIAALWTVQ
jgi:hypothetical protein